MKLVIDENSNAHYSTPCGKAITNKLCVINVYTRLECVSGWKEGGTRGVVEETTQT